VPRISAEARAGAMLRADGMHPKPPEYLSVPAKKVWAEMVECRPFDFFQPGALHLLEQLVVTVVAARAVAPRLEADPFDADIADLYGKYMQKSAMLCQKLRLSIQSALRTEAGKLDEIETLPKDDTLFGGNVVRF
jgi:hypothetical protein